MSLIKSLGFRSLWVRSMRRARDEYEDTQSDLECARPVYRWLIYGIVTYILGAIAFGLYWSLTPSPLSVPLGIRSQILASKMQPNLALPKGVATVSTLINIGENLLEKSGGYIANDFAPPGLWLDNMPNWELGVVLQLRDTTQILNSSFSQSNLTHDIDVDLQKAEVRFNFSHKSWGFPSTESQYRAGIEHLKQYNDRLMRANNSEAKFHADAQHLNDYLAGVEQRLRQLSQRLTASVGPIDNSVAQSSTRDSTKIVSGLYTKTPWLKVDDVFYEARGSAWAQIALLQAVGIDFADVLKNKSAERSFSQIIRELQPTQQTIFSPIILNGDGFGVVANHSLTMASHLARAQAAISDCRRLLLVPTIQ